MSAPIQRSVRKRMCSMIGCGQIYPTPHGGPQPAAFCSPECHTAFKRLNAKTPRPRKQLPRTAGTRKRKPIAVASKEQAAKRSAGVSIVGGASEGLDAAHLTPRPLGGCDDPLCVVPLTRDEHRAFDAGELDVLPYLVAHQMHAEIAHALEHYRCDLLALLERLTGCKWAPVEREARAA